MKTNNKNQFFRMFILSGILFLSVPFFASASAIKGHFLDNNEKPVPYATATLVDSKTMEVVKGGTTDCKGEYVIDNIKSGEYILTLQYVGYEKNEKIYLVVDEESFSVEMEPIVLKEVVVELPELTVTGNRKMAVNQVNQLTENKPASNNSL